MAKDSDIIRSELPLRIIELKESVLEDNNKDAQELRETLRSRKTCLINLMSGPGSGKTSTLLALQPYLEGTRRRFCRRVSPLSSFIQAECAIWTRT